MEKEKICLECGKEIPEHRLKKKGRIVTCSKVCSNLRNTTAYKDRKKQK